jgi:hypothetical protein
MEKTMKKVGTYIGVCDFSSQGQVFEILDYFQSLKTDDLHLMIGAMTSYKVMHRQPTKWASIFPKPEALKYIFSASNAKAFNCIHYADYDNREELAETLLKVAKYCGPGLHAVQLDMIWPDPQELQKFKESLKESNEEPSDLQLILQVNEYSMKQYQNNPTTVAEVISNQYSGLISHVLLDRSMGKGKAIDIVALEPYIKAIRSYNPDIEIAVAGGLGPDTVTVVGPLIEKYQVSTDAQSKLRPSGKLEDPINSELIKQYLSNAVALYPSLV